MEYKTVGEAHSELQQNGFDKTFEGVEDFLRCRETGCMYAACDGIIQGVHRFEGESDPAEMSVVYALEMSDGEEGTLIDSTADKRTSEVDNIFLLGRN